MSVGLKIEDAASLNSHFQTSPAVRMLLYKPLVSAKSVVPVGRTDWHCVREPDLGREECRADVRP
jgi:hypothetical protein